MALIEINNLYFRYKDGTQALRGLTLRIEGGRKTAILGPNGAGKSTMLLHLNGIHLAQQGEVLFAGEAVSRSNERQVRSRVGMVFQDPDDQVFSATVWEDVAFGPSNMGLSHKEIEARVHAALKATGMWDYAGKAPYHLSYGQKKRVAIAGILAMDPEVIILDEPVAFLDPRGKDTVFAILNELNRRGATVIIATHDVDLAAEWADDVIVIAGGRCLAQGGTELLVNERVIREAELRYPVVARIFQELPELELPVLPGNVPAAVAALRRHLFAVKGK